MEGPKSDPFDFSDVEPMTFEVLARIEWLKESGLELAPSEDFAMLPYEPLPADMSDGIGETSDDQA